MQRNEKRKLQLLWRPNWVFPHLGQRLIKTAVAVFLCLAFYAARGYRGESMPTEAAITAMICMQPYMRGTKDNALQRVWGTIVGAFWGLTFLLLMMLVPQMGARRILLFALMSLGTLLSMYTTVVIHRQDAAVLAGIVFLCVVIAYPDIEQPLESAFHQILGVFVGTGIAILVNTFRLPRVHHRERVMFVRTRDLVPDQLTEIPGAVLYRLSYLYQDGARICLISQHAPAFILSQVRNMDVKTPAIVMDGAAIFDIRENRFLWFVYMPTEGALWLRDRLREEGISFFVYVVHRDRTRVYHHGPLNEAGKAVQNRMRKSLYRDYLDEEDYDPKEIMYMKAVGPTEEMKKLERSLGADSLGQHRLRSVLRPQAGVEGASGLYFYAKEARVDTAEQAMMALLREEKHQYLTSVEVFSPEEEWSEKSAARLLRRIGRVYEPLWILDRIEGNRA